MVLTKYYKKLKAPMDKVKDDMVAVFSAQAAFFIIISFFPFLMLLLTLLRYLPVDAKTLLNAFTSMLPKAIHDIIGGIINDIYHNAGATLLSITAISALWSASKGFLAIVRGMNSIYDIEETRNFIKLRLMATLYTLIFIFLILVTLLILVFGNSLYHWIQIRLPDIQGLALLIISIRTLVALAILTIFFLLVYIFIPDRKTRLRDELPGAIFSACGWLIISYLYSMYIDQMSGDSPMYGSLTAMVFLLLWVYFCMYTMFLGGEINMLLKHFFQKRK